MTEEYELAAFDRHSLNFDNVALWGALPTSVTTDPSPYNPCRELAYLPAGEMSTSPCGVGPSPSTGRSVGPTEVLASLKQMRTVTQAGDEGESASMDPPTARGALNDDRSEQRS